MHSSAAARIDVVARAFAERLGEHRDAVGPLTLVAAAELGRAAADFVVAQQQTPRLPRVIGPVYRTEDVARWLTGGPDRLTGEAVRKRAKQRRLVGFRTDDGQWVFPGWQFDRVSGRLRPRPDVVQLWQSLPQGGWMGDAALAGWMAAPLQSLQANPAERAHQHGADDPALLAAVARLRARIESR